MRIETHGDTVSFDGGTMSRKDAMQFALDVANAAWPWGDGDDNESRLAFTTVRAVAAIRDLYWVESIHGNKLSNTDVNTLLHDRQAEKMRRGKA